MDNEQKELLQAQIKRARVRRDWLVSRAAAAEDVDARRKLTNAEAALAILEMRLKRKE